MQIGQPEVHPKSQYFAESLGDSCMERSLKGSRGVNRLPVQGRSEVRHFHTETSRHMWKGFHVVGNHVNRTLRGAHKWGSSSPSHRQSSAASSCSTAHSVIMKPVQFQTCRSDVKAVGFIFLI
ncbi:hypothetical protein LEMLEM_LOCUS647 [Lemmus lemmus]